MKVTEVSQNAKASGSTSTVVTGANPKDKTPKKTNKEKATRTATNQMLQLGPPSTASIEAAAKAASNEQVDPEIRGDPRMNRAVQAKLKNPQISLSDALRIGGFDYPPRATASAVDNENVTLGQRKNQLNRRLRQARLNHAAMLERGIANGTISVSDAASVCGSVASACSNHGIKRGSAFMSTLPGSEAQKRQAVGNYQTTLNALGVTTNSQPLQNGVTLNPIELLQNHQQQLQQNQDPFKTAGATTVPAVAPNQALIGQPPHLLDQLLQMQSMQQQQQQSLQGQATNGDILQQQMVSFQQTEIPKTAPPPPPPQGIILQAQPQQLQLVATNNGGNTQYVLVPVVPQDSQSVAGGSVVSVQPILMNHHPSSNASVADASSYAAVTVSTKASSHHGGGGHHHHNNSHPVSTSPHSDDHDDDDEEEDDDDDGIEDERLKAGLQIFGREIRALYQSAMLRAGFSPDEVHESNQTYHSFAFHAWRKECQTLQKLIRSDDQDDGMSQAQQQQQHMSSGRSVASHHSNVQHQHHMSSGRSVASHHSMSGGRSVASYHQVSVHGGNHTAM